MTRQRFAFPVAAILVVTGAAAIAIGQGDKRAGRIGPDSRIQPSGRVLTPAGKLTPKLGNLPVGGALTTNGKFLWTLSGGRGRNDIRVVLVASTKRCRAGRKGRGCRLARRRKAGKVVQTIPMPGVSGGIAMSPDGTTAYVSGVKESSHKDQQVADDVPGKAGDAIHVFRLNPNSGHARRDGTIAVPPPGDAPIPQNFPPTNTTLRSWPRDVAVSPDGKRLLVALNLADRAAIIDTTTKHVRYVRVGSYPYGAGITRDGRTGLVSNESDGTVSVIDLAAARITKTITVGPHLSHPEGIAVDPRADRAYVAVTHSDYVSVIDTRRLEVARTLSVARPEGNGTAPVALSVTSDGRRLLVADSGEDAVAVFDLPQGDAAAHARRERRSARAALAARADAVLRHEGRVGLDDAQSLDAEAAEVLGEEAEERAEARLAQRPVAPAVKDYELIGRIPVGSYPTGAFATPGRKRLVWLSAKGLGVGPNPRGPNPIDPRDTDDEQGNFQYLPTQVFGNAGILSFPSDARLRRYTAKADAQFRPRADMKPPAGSPIVATDGSTAGPSAKIKHVFYIVRENRTYDQILGDDARGDGDPGLTLFGPDVTPNAHALAKRFPLLDHVYANSEASIDGHFWTSAAAVSDYVTKNWHQNYGGRGRPYDFGVYAVTWPSQRFLFDQAQKQRIPYFNFGEAVAGVVPLADKDRNAAETAEVTAKLANSDLGLPAGCFANDASSGGIDVVLSATGAAETEVYDSSLPTSGANPPAYSRFDCFKQRFDAWVATGSVPAFVYATFANDHTSGTTPGRRTPKAMIAENDLALGQVVDLISHSPIWKESLILVIEDDSQNGADHVDAHRIPAFAISPYAKQGAVIHTRYDFLSFIRTLEQVIGMKPLNLFDATAVPMYDVFTTDPSNDAAYDAITPQQNITERNGPRAPGARISRQARIGDPGRTDQTPQRLLDRILWQSVHGAGAEPPPPGPNGSALDEEALRQLGVDYRRGIVRNPPPRAPDDE